MKIKYVKYNDCRVYALYYARQKTIYYNTEFNGKTKIYFLIW